MSPCPSDPFDSDPVPWALPGLSPVYWTSETRENRAPSDIERSLPTPYRLSRYEELSPWLSALHNYFSTHEGGSLAPSATNGRTANESVLCSIWSIGLGVSR